MSKFKPGDKVKLISDLGHPSWKHGEKIVTIYKVCEDDLYIKEDLGTGWAGTGRDSNKFKKVTGVYLANNGEEINV